MTTQRATSARRRHHAPHGDELIGLDNITAAVRAAVGYDVDRATVGRWLARGVRGFRIEGRRIGQRWATTRAAIETWARASGALPEGES